VNGILERVDRLDEDRRRQMFALLQRHFDGVSAEVFAADLDEKNWALLFEDEGELVGFSTLLLYPFVHAGETITVIYSGDTIVDPTAWGSTTLPRMWIDAVRRLHAENRPANGPGQGRLVWLLITSGFRTYRFLPVFWRDFHPRHDATIPPDVAALRDALARERFGARYDTEQGVVRLGSPQALREHLASVPEARRSDPHVAFFLSANPGHGRGDELVCITELSEDNLTRAGWRMVRSGPARGAEGGGGGGGWGGDAEEPA
jgi:hypothetical protein